MKKKTVLLLSMALLAVSLTSCGRFQNQDAATAATTDTEEAERVVTVQATAATTGHIASYRSFGGDVVPHDTKSIIPTTSGEVKELLIEEGDHVTKDEVVARIDQSRAGMQYKPSEIKAPMDGTVSAVTTQVGAQAGIGQPIGTVISTDNLEIKFDVAERLLYAVRLGGKVSVSFDAYPGETFDATIIKMAATLNTATRTREITVKLDKADDRIISGMYARVNVLLDEADDAVLVPSSAISGDHVFIADGGVARKAVVKTGIQADGMVQILDGVQAGDAVITAGISQLSDGTAVNVL